MKRRHASVSPSSVGKSRRRSRGYRPHSNPPPRPTHIRIYVNFQPWGSQFCQRQTPPNFRQSAVTGNILIWYREQEISENGETVDRKRHRESAHDRKWHRTDSGMCQSGTGGSHVDLSSISREWKRRRQKKRGSNQKGARVGKAPEWWWYGCGYNHDSTSIRISFDRNSIRPLNDLRHDRPAALRSRYRNRPARLQIVGYVTVSK